MKWVWTIFGATILGNIYATEGSRANKKDTLSAVVVNPLKGDDGLLLMPKEQVSALIDSLLDLPQAPSTFIEQVCQQVNHIQQWEELNEIYPAFGYYGDTWENTSANPYLNKPIPLDSVINIKLLNTGEIFSMPFEGVLTSPFGWREGKMHRGVDLDLNVMDPVKAVFSGKVRVARNYGGFGRVVIIRHANGLETLYAHLHKLKVKPNQEIKAGDVVGYGGSSGKSEGSHLHFECRFMGEAVDPQAFISFEDKKLASLEIVLKKGKHGLACFPKGAAFHIVKKGDYLFKIAEKYGTDVPKLCEINRIKSNKKLKVGESLRVL